MSLTQLLGSLCDCILLDHNMGSVLELIEWYENWMKNEEVKDEESLQKVQLDYLTLNLIYKLYIELGIIAKKCGTVVSQQIFDQSDNIEFRRRFLTNRFIYIKTMDGHVIIEKLVNTNSCHELILNNKPPPIHHVAGSDGDTPNISMEESFAEYRQWLKHLLVDSEDILCHSNDVLRCCLIMDMLLETYFSKTNKISE